MQSGVKLEIKSVPIFANMEDTKANIGLQYFVGRKWFNTVENGQYFKVFAYMMHYENFLNDILPFDQIYVGLCPQTSLPAYAI